MQGSTDVPYCQLEGKQCAVCSIAATQRCSACRLVFYCGRVHQKQHWRVHRLECRPFKVEQNESLGRHLVALRDIPAGELLLRERPLLKGPSVATPPICLGCYMLLSATCVPCTRCGWPMCSVSCADLPDHVAECSITANVRGEKVSINFFGQFHPMYSYVTVLRALSLRETDPNRWHKLCLLQSHCNLWGNNSKYELECHFIKKILSEFKLTKFSEEDVMCVWGILKVNSFAVKVTDPGYLTVYEWGSLLEHSCSANCMRSFNEEGQIVICAAKPIGRGEHLSLSYVGSLGYREMRRQSLRKSKHFWCRCPRCIDPTEYGTYFSAMRCRQSGCNGLCVPSAEWLKLEPADDQEEPAWCCQCCKQLLPSEQVLKQLAEIQSAYDELDSSNVDQCMEFLRRQEAAAWLGPNHSILTKVRILVALELGQTPDGFTGLSEEVLILKEKLCSRLVQLISTLCPAENCYYGELHYDLAMTQIEIATRRILRGEMEIAAYQQILKEYREHLTEAANLLQYEPEIVSEGKIAQSAKEQICLLDDTLHCMHSLHSSQQVTALVRRAMTRLL